MAARSGSSFTVQVIPKAAQSLDQVHLETRKQLFGVQQRLQELEQLQQTQAAGPASASDASSSSSAVLEALQTVRIELQQLERLTSELTQLASRAPPTQRALWERRAVQLQSQLHELGTFWRQLHTTERQRHWHIRARESLLEGADLSRSKANADATVLDLERLEEQSLSRSSQQADGIVSSGHDILEALRQQHHTLKAVRRKTLDMAHRLGISQRLLRRIQRRARNDMRLVCGGFTTIALLVCTLWYFKSRVS